MRSALLTAFGVLLVCAAIVVLVYSSLAVPVFARAEAPSAAVAAEPKVAAAAVAISPARTAPAPVAARARESEPLARPWPTDPAQLVRALAPLQREVSEGLEGLDRAGGCRWGDMFARLTLSTGDGEVKVEAIDVLRRPPPPDPDGPDHDPAAFEPREVTDEAAASCVRQAMARSFRAPSARPGRRWQTSFSGRP